MTDPKPSSPVAVCATVALGRGGLIARQRIGPASAQDLAPAIPRVTTAWSGVLGALGIAAVLAALALSGGSAAAQAAPGFSLHESPRPVAEIAFADGTGQAMSLADFRGKVVLLNVWATWCAPCRREMPTLDRLQAELGGPAFAVVALSIDSKGLAAVRKFYREIGLRTLPIYVDPSGSAQRSLRVFGIPTTLLLDPDGNEIGRLAGPAEWDSPEMVAFIRGYVERRSGVAPVPAADEAPRASDAVREPLSPRVRDRGWGSSRPASGQPEPS